MTQKKKTRGGARVKASEHTTMAKPCRMWTLTHMETVCEVGRQKGLDAGPLDALEFCFLGLRTKDQGGGTGPGQPEHTRMVKPCRMWTLTQMETGREVDRQKDADAGPLESEE